jgi:hypothetical protein
MGVGAETMKRKMKKKNTLLHNPLSAKTLKHIPM